MTRLLSTGFENGVATGGKGFDAVTFPAQVTQTTGSKKHGTYGVVCDTTGYLVKTLVSQVCTVSFYYTPTTAFAAGSNPIVRMFVSGSPFIGGEINQKNSGKLVGILQSGSGALVSTVDSTTILAIGTTYLIDARFDLSGTTWLLDYKISDTNGSVLFTAAQLSYTGRTATSAPVLRLGPDGAGKYGFDDVELDDTGGVYPIGAHTSDDTEAAGLTTFPPSWIDDPSEITGGIMVGLNSPFGGTYAAPYPPVMVATEGATKLNRHSNFSTFDYSQVAAQPNLYAARNLMNGNIFADGIARVAIISGLGFDGFTPDWPAGGLNDFTNGLMDTVLDGWITLFLTLPDWPFFWRIWREMNSLGVIYGSAGATITGGHHGLNETAADYVTAWRYVHDYVTPNVPNIRWMWSPQVGDGAGGLSSVAALATRYPGSAYVDAVAPTGYISSPSRTAAQAFANVYTGWNPSTGTIDKKLWGVSESQVDRTDASRIADITQYTTSFTNSLPLTSFVNFWDCIMTCQYPVADTPAGWLSAFQTVVSTPPFLGFAAIDYTDTCTGTMTLTGSRVESYTQTRSYHDTPNGTLTLSGTRTEARTMTNTPSGTLTLSGSLVEASQKTYLTVRSHGANLYVEAA